MLTNCKLNVIIRNFKLTLTIWAMNLDTIFKKSQMLLNSFHTRIWSPMKLYARKYRSTYYRMLSL